MKPGRGTVCRTLLGRWWVRTERSMNYGILLYSALIVAATTNCREPRRPPPRVPERPPFQMPANPQPPPCPPPLTRVGAQVRGIVTAIDSSRIWLTEVPQEGMPARHFVYSSHRCLPIETEDGAPVPRSSLSVGQAVVVWMHGVLIPTQPIQAVATGILVYKPKH